MLQMKTAEKWFKRFKKCNSGIDGDPRCGKLYLNKELFSTARTLERGGERWWRIRLSGTKFKLIGEPNITWES